MPSVVRPWWQLLLGSGAALTKSLPPLQVNEYMKYAISEQERIGVDVLVHGEPERSDM